MAQISVPGAGGTPLVFTVTGTSTTNYATAFAAAVNNASANGSLTLNVVNSSGQTSTGSVVLNELVAGSATTFTPLTGQYTVIDETATVTGSSMGNDSVLAGNDTTTAGPFSATYIAVGSNNQITFLSGNNTYDGSRTGSGDTITAGSGSDTINTGTGSSTLFGGTGTSLMVLNDTVGGDVVFIGDGHSTVIANGSNDIVAASAPGQLIIGGNAGDNLAIAIGSGSVAGPANDVIIARGSNTTVFDSVGGNTVFGGTGNLNFIGHAGGESPVQDSILAGAGTTTIFGFANADITFASTSSSGPIAVIAGIGNETLNGANAGNFAVFGDTTAAASSTSTFVGGTDSTTADFFSTGGGNEAYALSGATDILQLDTVNAAAGPANITIFGFGGADMVGFGNDSANAQSDLNSGTLNADGNLVLTLSDHTTVTFVGVQTLTGHTLT